MHMSYCRSDVCSSYLLGRRPAAALAAPLGDAHGRPLVGERGLQDPPPGVQLAEAVAVGDPGAGEEHLVEAGVAGSLAKGAHPDALLAAGEPQERDAPVTGLDRTSGV